MRGDGGPADLEKTKMQFMSTCVTPACLYGTETLAITEIPQMLQVCENNWVRQIARTTRADTRIMVVKGRDRSAEKLYRETGDEQTKVGRTRRKDGE